MRRPRLRTLKNGATARVVRLNDGRYVTIKMISSRPEDIEKASPEEIWTTGDGRKLLPKDMDMRHLLNTIKLIEQKSADAMAFHKISIEDIDLPSFAKQFYPVYEHMKNEMLYRIGTKERPVEKPENRMVTEKDDPNPFARRFDFEL